RAALARRSPSTFGRPSRFELATGSCSELDADRTALRLFAFEELTLGEVEVPREDVAWERLDRVVVVEHAVVVELPCVRDAILGRRQLLLKRQEVLVRLEVGIRLGDCEQTLQRAGELVLRLRLFLNRPTGLGVDRVRSGVRDRF